MSKKEDKPHGRGVFIDLKKGWISLGQFKLGEFQTTCGLVGDFVIQRDSFSSSQQNNETIEVGRTFKNKKG